MNRRDTVLALRALSAAPLAVRAQPAQKVYRIGVLSLALPREGERFVLLSGALRELGYEERRNFVFDYRFAEGREDRLPGLAADLVVKNADLIVAISNLEILAAKRATSTIPIVMVYGLAPMETGLVASLARPGGKLTGTTVASPETAGKILEVLRDAVPRVIEFVARQRLPAIYTNKPAVTEGGLISYSPDYGALVRRTAAIIDRILKGAKPAELPVEQPTKYDLMINLETAKALGLTIPQSLLIRADEVIQ